MVWVRNHEFLIVKKQDLERLAISVIRGLAMDAPHTARSGHQGTAMALAPLAHVLWTRTMIYDSSLPSWPNRDRFILSAGHASILLYSMLYLTGYQLKLEDLQNFRKLGSLTPGHPEAKHTPGVEVTTGPLGQGLANGVGMAIAERNLRARFGSDLCDHRIWVICSDGDLEEGISHEAASLAGHLGLGKLIVAYDDNHITIDGPTELALTDRTSERFESYGWHVNDLGEKGEDLDAIESALSEASEIENQPSLVILRTHIGTPSSHIDTAKVHGYSLTDQEIIATKETLDLPSNEDFWIPNNVLEFYRQAGIRNSAVRINWEKQIDKEDHPQSEWLAVQNGSGLPGWEKELPKWNVGESVATRKASNACLQSLTNNVPGIIGGGADLTSNTGTTITGHGIQSYSCPEGRQIYFGIREHAMGAISNGMALHSGMRPVTGTFLVFSDYMRGAVRLAALSQARSIFIWSHDSVAVGEDGPTHQPIEHIASLRVIPGIDVFRPADANETVGAWKAAIQNDKPTALLLTRQDVNVLEGTANHSNVAQGGYILLEPSKTPDITLLATGSEVSIAVEASHELSKSGLQVRVVSMPCIERFEIQTREYQESILPNRIPTISIEAASTFGWSRWADISIGIDRFGISAPGPEVLTELGITKEAIIKTAKQLLQDERKDF